MGLVDTHCHLQDAAFDNDREEVLARALTELEWLVVIGDSIESSRLGSKLCRRGVYAAAGVHPYHAESVDTAALAALRELAELDRVVAIGEIGLDYHHAKNDYRVQRKAFEAQLALAAELQLPVVIHNRDAHDDLGAILSTYAANLCGGIMHCFAGGLDFVERSLEWGFYISFAGNATFPKAQALRDAAKAIPLDRLLVETDSPYLAPQPRRGKRCEPAFVRFTAETLAQVKGIDFDTFAAQTTANASRLYRISASGTRD